MYNLFKYIWYRILCIFRPDVTEERDGFTVSEDKAMKIFVNLDKETLEYVIQECMKQHSDLPEDALRLTAQRLRTKYAQYIE